MNFFRLLLAAAALVASGCSRSGPQANMAAVRFPVIIRGVCNQENPLVYSFAGLPWLADHAEPSLLAIRADRAVFLSGAPAAGAQPAIMVVDMQSSIDLDIIEKMELPAGTKNYPALVHVMLSPDGHSRVTLGQCVPNGDRPLWGWRGPLAVETPRFAAKP